MLEYIKNASKNGESYRKLDRAHIGLTNILIKNRLLPLNSGEKVLTTLYYISCFQPLFTSQKWFIGNFDRVVAEDYSKDPNSIIGFDRASMTGAMMILNLDPQKHLLDIPQNDLLDIIESA